MKANKHLANLRTILPSSVVLAVLVGLIAAISSVLWRPDNSTLASKLDTTFEEFTRLADTGHLHPAVSASKRLANCAPYADSELYLQRQHSLTVGPDQNFISLIENAKPNTEILLLDGTYTVNRPAILVNAKTTIRSASQNSQTVTFVGPGYQVPGEGLMIIGDDVTVADLSITAMRDHAISIKPMEGATHAIKIYNVHLYDIGTQHIKLSSGGSDQGLVACSKIGYSASGAKGDYNGAIDLHAASNWVIRDNTIYNIRGDGSGCNVDKDCGRYQSGPAVLVWNNSTNTHITRNRIFNSYRNIALGLGRGHTKGKVDNNVIVQSTPGDAGIELQTATDTLVENNLVILSGDYPGAIEYRDSTNVTIQHNQLTSTPHDRGNNQGVSIQRNEVDQHLFSRLASDSE